MQKPVIARKKPRIAAAKQVKASNDYTQNPQLVKELVQEIEPKTTKQGRKVQSVLNKDENTQSQQHVLHPSNYEVILRKNQELKGQNYSYFVPQQS